MSATEDDAKIFTDITLPSIDLTPILIFLAIQIAFFLGTIWDCKSRYKCKMFNFKISVKYLQFCNQSIIQV